MFELHFMTKAAAEQLRPVIIQITAGFLLRGQPVEDLAFMQMEIWARPSSLCSISCQLLLTFS